MGSLNEYKTLAEKEQFYNCIRIETEQEFDNYFNQIQTNSNGYAFRSINEAKFKLYSSAQRQWIWNDLSNAHTSFNNYILSLISQIQQNSNITTFFSSNKIPTNDFVILALLQHYSQPSPLIDFTYNPLTTLFFAFDRMTPSNNGTIDDYVSIYRINYDQPCFCSIQEVNTNGVLNLEKELQKLDIPISKIDTSSVTTSIANLNYTNYSSLDYILIHGDKMGITNISIPLLGFTCTYDITNPNLKNQEGLFILNTSEDKSLGELLREKHRFVSPLIDCFDVRKELGNENEVEDRLYEIQYKGYTPVIAHVERYFKDSLDIERIQDFIDNGYLIQVNATSFLGYHGKHAQKFAYQLLNQGLLHVIATDTHRCDGHRSPCLQEVFDLLVKKYSYEDIHTLMYENPLHIINNEEVDLIEGKTSFFKKIFKRR